MARNIAANEERARKRIRLKVIGICVIIFAYVIMISVVGYKLYNCLWGVNSAVHDKADYGEQMVVLFRDKEQDVLTRDFAVQHIGLYAHVPPQNNERKENKGVFCECS
ncbi:MAG: hypothetical protein IJL17_15585 [Kiritimatiellae bacterium]|nr:hypothetical protein [Kiritimatiellia bacterium]